MLRSYLRLSPGERLLVLEAACRLVRAQLALRIVPFRQLARGLGVLRGSASLPASADQLDTAQRVGWAVDSAARHLPWKPICLPRAMAAQSMLRRRGIATTLHLGLDPCDNLRSHAWLAVGPRVVVGGRPDRYTVVSSFALNP